MKKLITYSVLLLSIVTLYSCLEDKGGFTDLASGKNLKPTVSFLGAQSNRYSIAIPISASESLPVQIAIGGGSPSDMSIHLQMDGQAAVDAYNTQLIKEGKAHGDTLTNGAIDPAKFTPFTLLPANTYTIPSYDVAVKKGDLTVAMPMTVNSSLLTVSGKYCLPLSIVSVSGNSDVIIADNFKSVLMYIQLKNKYDGLYKMTGTLVDAASSAIGPFSPMKSGLVTTGANQVYLYEYEVTGSAYHAIKSGASNSYYGEFGVIINFDPATNNVTSVSNVWAPASNSRQARLDPTGVNHWDPATKTLKIKYFMDQPSLGLLPRTSFDETYTYTGSR